MSIKPNQVELQKKKMFETTPSFELRFYVNTLSITLDEYIIIRRFV